MVFSTHGSNSSISYGLIINTHSIKIKLIPNEDCDVIYGFNKSHHNIILEVEKTPGKPMAKIKLHTTQRNDPTK